ncbi:MAG: hypothetical protein ACPGU1_11275 [Myxococcota bacterium]
MSEISNREALDGILRAVATIVDDPRPQWIDAYAHLLTEAILDRHHVGLLIGVARSKDLAESEAWITALSASGNDTLHHRMIQDVWALARREPLSEGVPVEANPFMRRLNCELRAYALEERGALVDAMIVRSELFDGWAGEAHDEQAFCGFDLVDDLMGLDRVDEANHVLDKLEPMVEALDNAVLEAELYDRWADVARERQDQDRAGQCYRMAQHALEDLRDPSPHLRLNEQAATVNELVQRGKLQRARTVLENPIDCGDHPFASRVLQRRLTSLCQLYTTLDDKRSLFEVLEQLIESVIEVRWALFGTLSSHLDDLVNLACQFGHGTRAEAFLAQGRALVIGDPSEAWLDIAAIRIALWKGQESEVEALLESARQSPLVIQDLFYCQTVTTLINEYGSAEQIEESKDALEQCTASLKERRLFPRAANSLQFKAQGLAQEGHTEQARQAFRDAVTVLREPGHNREQVIEAAMDWATWEIRSGNMDRLEEPLELVIAHSDDAGAPALMARLSFQQAMYFAVNPNAQESEEDPKAVVGRWIALAADQYLEGNRLAEANGVYMHLADWLDGQGEYKAATEILELVAQGAMSTGDTQLIWHAALVAANRLEQEDDGEAAVQLLMETLESCESDDSATRGAQHFELGNLLNAVGQHDAALNHYKIAQEGLVDGSVRDRARVLIGLGMSHWHTQSEARAVTEWRAAFELAQCTADRDFICDLALRIDTQMLERQDRVSEARIALLETLMNLGDRCRWELIANGSDLPLRLAEEYARTDHNPTYVTETIHTLRNLAEAVTNVGLTRDGTLLLQRASGIEMLRGNHEAGLSLMREVLERIEASAGTVLRSREGLLQAALLAAGGLVHEAWDRVSEVRDWLATIDDSSADEEALDELTLTCQLQCATLHLLGDKADQVVGPLTELIETCEIRDRAWPATQSARVTLAAALINLGHSARASEQLMALEASLDEGTNGWFNSVIMAGRLGQRALGEALISGVKEALGQSEPSRWSSTEIALQCSADWLAFTSGEPVDTSETEALAHRAMKAHDFNLATVLTLMTACYATGAGDTSNARRAVAEAIELSRRHWAMDEFGLMWGVLLPPELKCFAATLLEADRLQHVN